MEAFLESESESDDSSQHENDEDHHEDEKNFIRIPWEGAPPKIVIAKSQRNVLRSPFESEQSENNDGMKCVRKIWFCRDVNDSKQRTLKAWDVPLTWDTADIASVFSIFGDIDSTAIRKHNNIVDRHCVIKFREASQVEFAMHYDSSSIIQPAMRGRVQFGVSKYLRDYIKTRPLNIDELQYEVDRFMASFDKLQSKKREQEKKSPRRHRGWIQKRDKDGFTKIHYPNKWERKRHRAHRLPAIEMQDDVDVVKRAEMRASNKREGVKVDELNPKDTFNAPPQPNLYDAGKKDEYYKANRIKDIHKKKKMRILAKQKQMKEKVKFSLREKSEADKAKRLNIGQARWKRVTEQKQRWNKEMSHTTDMRKHRRFKP
eukprot:CAMPEP_0197063392 /NCGR_PEP_ID=MMETSP1384-20130603/152195_1 /TAXON_ID=29189 /ORGANISM="Ammonia sp." /LENGTH=372 /DNA_ID=CAMNT_0042499623 /DNA_START=13 /DNA_END=1127 /DNA_ORIENTATION=+